MLVVETVAKIRRAQFAQGKGIKEICRELRPPWKVVRKVLRPDETAFSYQLSVQPQLGLRSDDLNSIHAASLVQSKLLDFSISKSSLQGVHSKIR
jgi:hypothetical protein